MNQTGEAPIDSRLANPLINYKRRGGLTSRSVGTGNRNTRDRVEERTSHGARYALVPSLRNDLVDDSPVDVRQAEVAPCVTVRQLGVVQPQLVQDRRMQVV